MTREETERMAEGIVRLRDEILRRREPDAEGGAVELTPAQGAALRAAVRLGPLRVGELARALGVSVATASRTVDGLAALGLVERTGDPADSRAVRVCPTAKGVEEQGLRRAGFVRALERLLEELSEAERARLADSLETLSALLVARATAEDEDAGASARRYEPASRRRTPARSASVDPAARR
jgi:DNA-binding MarR family transcriptional regulator